MAMLAEAVLSGGDVVARLSTQQLFSLMEKSVVDEAGEGEGAAADST